MDFDSTSGDNLVEYTRFLVGDPSTAPSTMWTAAEIGTAINAEYFSMMKSAMDQNSGIGTAVAYETSVTDQVAYSLPTDWISWISVELETAGQDLSADDTLIPVFLKPRNENVAVELWRNGDITSPTYYFQRGSGETDGNFGIVAPPATGGSNAIRLTYKKKPTALASTGIPQFPEPYHDLIAYRAAVVLKISKDLPIGDLAAYMVPKQRAFDQWASDLHDDDYDFSIPIAGKLRRKKPFKSGSIAK